MDLPPDYPLELTEVALLTSGVAVTFRAILPSDGPALERLFHRLSPESVYRRFFSPLVRPPPAMIQRLATVDYVDRLAIVAEIDAEIVGVARYDRSGWQRAAGDAAVEGEAEAAVIVEDAWQGQGIATRLLWRLSAAARERGIRAFVAEVLGENRPMMGLLHTIAEDVEVALADGSYLVRLWLSSILDTG